MKFKIIYVDKFSISEITSNSHTPGVFVKKKLESKASDVHVLIAVKLNKVNYRPWLLYDCSRYYQFISVENVLVREFFFFLSFDLHYGGSPESIFNSLTQFYRSLTLTGVQT